MSMESSNLILLFLYSVFFIVVTFILREKYPNRYSIGCTLCMFAPAWGHFYKKAKYGFVVWLVFMVASKEVAKECSGSLEEIMVGWLIVGGISSLVMFLRLWSDKAAVAAKAPNDNQVYDVIIDIEKDEIQNKVSHSFVTKGSEQNKTDQRGVNQYIKFETGLSRVGIIFGIIMAVILATYVFTEINSYQFSKNKLLTFSFIVTLSTTVGLLSWVLVVLVYRIFVWVKYGFNDKESYTVTNIFNIENKTWLIVYTILIFMTLIQFAFMSDNNKFKIFIEAPASISTANLSALGLDNLPNIATKGMKEFTPQDDCEKLNKDAKYLKKELEQIKLIYGRYPKNIDTIDLTRFYQKSIHIQKITDNSYKISISGNNCDSIYTIESNMDDVNIQTVQR